MFDYFENRYNTPLNSWQEMLFQASPYARDTYDYDARGAWLEMQLNPLFQRFSNGHLGDKYKKPNHPTFSDESMYHGNSGYYGGHWSKDVYGRDVFTPGMNFYAPPTLGEYFRLREPGVVLTW